jgi:26S proteasome regulatory subunit N2
LDGFLRSRCGGRHGNIGTCARELQNDAKETQHKKIIRGIGMALALVNYDQEDKAADTINEMNRDRIGLAFCGTGSNKAIRSLLHAAVVM